MTVPTTPAKHWSMTEVARMLISSNALASIKTQDAIVLAQRMRLARIPSGGVLLKAGATNTDFMAFVMEGEAVVENTDPGTGETVVLGVLTQGHMIGEMSVVANAPRSATVTASSDMVVTILDQSAFALLIQQAPEVACGFLTSLLHGVTDRLRESNRKLLMLTKINQSMYEELEASRQNESHLADLFVSAHNFSTDQGKVEEDLLPERKVDCPDSPAQSSVVKQTSDSQPPAFTQTYPI